MGPELLLVVASAQPQDQPAAADLVDCGGHLGEQRGIAEGGAGDKRSQLDPAGRGGEGGQQRPALPHPALRFGVVVEWEPVPEVVHEPEGVEAEGLGPPGHRHEVRPAGGLAAHPLLNVGKHEANLERPPSDIVHELVLPRSKGAFPDSAWVSLTVSRHRSDHQQSG
jgi:hypothetical protein